MKRIDFVNELSTKLNANVLSVFDMFEDSEFFQISRIATYHLSSPDRTRSPAMSSRYLTPLVVVK